MTRRATFLHTLENAVASRGVALLGVCNVTPDSFSDGGQFEGEEAARARVDTLIAEGAAMVDIGGESTRPGARPVPAETQLARILPVVRYASSRVCVTVDTTNPRVAEAALAAGAHAVNDVSCLADPALASVVAAAEAGFILMHARGPQEKMAGFSQYPEEGYGSVVDDVLAEWSAAARRAEAAGVPRSALVCDPGLGFMKSARQSAELLRCTDAIVARAGVPVAIGASRKSFLVALGGEAPAGERLGASLAAALWAAQHGAAVIRVHDVRATAQCLAVHRALAATGELTAARKEVPRA